jgi:4-amino-4-deoxy-L-arabinose transferase-like glycosyltransferase
LNSLNIVEEFIERNQRLLTAKSLKIDVCFIVFLVIFSIFFFFFQVSLNTVPTADQADYLNNARAWLTHSPLQTIIRPPLISWIAAGTWVITGENWVIIKYLIPTFTIAAGFILYLLLREYKGSLFAAAVSVLTLTNPEVFVDGSLILTEGLSLFFLILSFFLLKSSTSRWRWLLAGISIGLTFASRYPVAILAFSILGIECFSRKNIKILFYAILGAAPVILVVVLAVYIKTGTFSGALQQDTHFTPLLSSFYIKHAVAIWGYSVILLPIAFLFKRTYTGRHNITFIVWFTVGLLFWSANATNHQPRFVIQFTPAVYFLVILAVENIAKMNISNLKLRLRGKENLGQVILAVENIAKMNISNLKLRLRGKENLDHVGRRVFRL